MVLDRDVPGMSGGAICSALMERAIDTRILMLTAASAVEQKSDGLSLGADDYLSKPFAFDELAARMRALGRRTARVTSPILERAGLRVDTNRRTVTQASEPVALTKKEFAVRGLSIVRAVVQAHGGEVVAEAGKDGGLVVGIVLPLRTAA